MPVHGDARASDVRSDRSAEIDQGVPRRGARPLSAAVGGDRMNRTGAFGTVPEEKFLKLEVQLQRNCSARCSSYAPGVDEGMRVVDISHV